MYPIGPVNREWTIRVTRFPAAEADLPQFLDLGAGLPIEEDRVH